MCDSDWSSDVCSSDLMIGAVEIVKDRESKESFDWKERVAYQIYKIALQHGVLLRPVGNIIYFMPPYVISEDEIDFMIKTARTAIKEYFETRPK